MSHSPRYRPALAGASFRGSQAGRLIGRLRGFQTADGAAAQDLGCRTRRQRGSILLEHIIALAVVSVFLPAILTALTALINNTDRAHDRTVAFELAQSQLESVYKQDYQNSPAGYTIISPLPDGYSISVTTSQAVSYTYPPPRSSPATEIVQQVTVTVVGRYHTLTIRGYKVGR